MKLICVRAVARWMSTSPAMPQTPFNLLGVGTWGPAI